MLSAHCKKKQYYLKNIYDSNTSLLVYDVVYVIGRKIYEEIFKHSYY